jgi:hypothetical protein
LEELSNINLYMIINLLKIRILKIKTRDIKAIKKVNYKMKIKLQNRMILVIISNMITDKMKI